MPRYTNQLAGARVASEGYAGGLNIRDAITALAPNEARVMENGTLDERGAFTKRLGCVSHGTFGGSGTERVISCYTFYRGLTPPQLIIHTSAGAVYYTNDPAANPITWGTVVTGMSGTAPFSYETFNGACYISNGVDSYGKWNGSNYSAFASAPKGKFIRLWKDTMWMTGVAGNNDRVYASAPGDAESWPAANWIDLGKGDGDFTTCLATDGINLIVFKRNRHFTIFDPVSLANRVVDFEKGCESHFSMVQFEGETFFLSRRGICKYYGDTPSEIISGKIDPMFDPAIININALGTVYAYTFNNQVGWAIPEAGKNFPTLQLEYYPRLAASTVAGSPAVGPFVLHRMPAATFTKFRSGPTEFLYGGHNANNKFMLLFAPVGTDDGQRMSATLETGSIHFGDPTRTKYIRRIRFVGRGLFTVLIKRNYEASQYKAFTIDLSGIQDMWAMTDQWGAGSWGPNSWMQDALVNPDAYGRYFQLRFSDASTTTGLKQFPIGTVDYLMATGEWGVYSFVAEGVLLGVRD